MTTPVTTSATSPVTSSVTGPATRPVTRPVTRPATTSETPSVLAAISRLSADLAAGADSATFLERLVEELARPLALDFAIRYELVTGDRAVPRHSATGIAARHLAALEPVPLAETVRGVVADLGATACADFPLTAGPSVLGVLVVGSRTRPAFDGAELGVLGLAAELLTVAVGRERDAADLEAARQARDEAQQRSAQLQTALVTNRTIAMAIGIVMARTGQTSEQAQAALVKVSQQTNRKLRDLADRIVLTGSVDLGPVSAATAAAAPAARRRSPRTPSSPTARP